MAKKTDIGTFLGLPTTSYKGLVPFGLGLVADSFQASRKTAVQKQDINTQAAQTQDFEALRQGASGIRSSQPSKIIESSRRKAVSQLGKSRGMTQRILDFFTGERY